MFAAFDSLRSVIGNLGNKGRDKSAGVEIVDDCISDMQLRDAYASNWIARKIVDIPADDSLRKWRTWNSEKHEAIEEEEVRLDVRRKVLEAYKQGRLYGGCALFIGTKQEPSEPLDVNAIGKGGLEYLSMFTRDELGVVSIGQDPFSPFYGLPEMYSIGSSDVVAEIHPSRLIRFTGDDHADPKQVNNINLGWGQSVLQTAFDSVKHASGSQANVASLIYEANVDVIGIPDLMNNIGTSEYQSEIMTRFQLAGMNKGINGMLMLDAEETYNRKTASFSHLPEVMEAFALYCASAADIPATRFLGRSPSGLLSTGEHDKENYQDTLQALQGLKIRPAMRLFDECLKRSAGAEDDATFDWTPLSQMNDEQLSTIGETITKSLKNLYDIGFTDQELRDIARHRLGEVGAFPHIEAVTQETLEKLDPNSDPDEKDPEIDND